MNALPAPLADTGIDAQHHEALRAALAPAVSERLAHLFRDSLQNGRIHLLYLPMLRHRLGQAATGQTAE